MGERPQERIRTLPFNAWVDFRAVEEEKLEALVDRANNPRRLLALRALAQLLVVYAGRRLGGHASVRISDTADPEPDELMARALAQARDIVDAAPAPVAPDEAAPEMAPQAPPEPAASRDASPSPEAQRTTTAPKRAAAKHATPQRRAAPDADTNDDKTRVQPVREKAAVAMAPGPDPMSRFFTRKLREHRAVLAASEKRLAVLERREHLVFVGAYGSAVSALALVVVGVVLVFAGHVTVGAVTGIAGLVPGMGTAGFRHLRASIRDDRRDVQAQEERSRDLVDAIEAVLAHPDLERRAQMVLELFGHLTDRAIA